MEVKACISDGTVIAIIGLGFSKSRKLNSTLILPKEQHLSVFFVLKIENALELQMRWEGAMEKRD